MGGPLLLQLDLELCHLLSVVSKHMVCKRLRNIQLPTRPQAGHSRQSIVSDTTAQFASLSWYALSFSNSGPESASRTALPEFSFVQGYASCFESLKMRVYEERMRYAVAVS